MVKKIIISSIFLALLIFFRYGFISAKTLELPEVALNNLPEQSGLYAIKGRPDLKLRVFNYPERGHKPVKPSPTLPPSEVCNITDPDSTSPDKIADWYLPSNFNYYINPSSVPSLVGSENLSKIASNSFKSWTDEINKVELSEVGTTTQTRAKFDGLNIVTWGRASAGTLGVTYIWYYNNGEAAEIDTIMNKTYQWTWSNPDSWTNPMCAFENTYDAQNIMTHEFGHWFGVDDNYEIIYQDNTMYGYGDKTETKKDTLTAGDIDAIQSIYINL